MIALSQLVPGVKPTDDLLVYLVQSDSRPSLWHRVDMACYSGFGGCSCESFQFSLEGKIKRSPYPEPKHECPHIDAARRYLAIMVAQGAIAKRSGEDDPKMSRKEWSNPGF